MTQPNSTVDRILFCSSVLLIGVVCLSVVVVPDQAAEVVGTAYQWIAIRFGLAYQWMTIGAVIVLVVLAFGRHGRLRLGGESSRPTYSTWSWMGMLFCAGIGAGLLYWSTIEWAAYLDSPPFGLEPSSVEAWEWAPTYGIFHWGLSAWCLYCLPTVAIAVPYYQRGIPFLRLSTSLVGLFGDDIAERPLGRFVDFVFIIALVGGTGTSLGLATPMIGACIGQLLAIEEAYWIDVGVVGICVILFAGSVYVGLDRGIKRLSDLNISLAGVFLLFVLVAGPTLFILKVGTNSVGLMLQEFIRMNTWTDPIRQTGFVEDWSVFYWAWWIAYGPFMGLFVTRISKGRTLKQLIVGMVGFGTLGCAVFYVVIGNTAMWMDIEGLVDVRTLIQEGQNGTAIAQIMAALPLDPLPLIVFVVMAWVFVATTYDSASYAIASSATRNLVEGSNPAQWHRVFWAFALAVLPITLMILDDLRAVKSAVLVVSLPLLVIGVTMCVSLFRTLKGTAEQ